MSKREWKAGPINKVFQSQVRNATCNARSRNKKAAIHKSQSAGKIVVIPPEVKK